MFPLYNTLLYGTVMCRPDPEGAAFDDRAVLYYNMSARGKAEALTKGLEAKPRRSQLQVLERGLRRSPKFYSGQKRWENG